MYADVILPLGLEGTFTYVVPESLLTLVQPFVRVIVPLGKSKTYTALLVNVTDEAPKQTAKDGKAVELKQIFSVVDEQPVLLPYQYKLWQWIAEYYLCPIGDVFRAAFPAGMKQEDGYKPRTETYIRLTEKYRNEAALHVALNMLSRSPRQQDVLNTFLQLSRTHPNPPVREGADNAFANQNSTSVSSIDSTFVNSGTNAHQDSLPNGRAGVGLGEVPVTREELTNTVRCSSAMVKNVIDRGILETYEVVVGRLNTSGKPHPERIQPLTPAQQKAFDELQTQPTTHPNPPVREGADNACANQDYTSVSYANSTFVNSGTNAHQDSLPNGRAGVGRALGVGRGLGVGLLFGVTGSGKTEIYIHLIQKAIDEGKQVLYLLPEIALTVQIMQRLHRIFGDRMGIYHSKYSDAERVEIWQKQLSDKPYDIILGARSAVFLPMTRLGLIIIDEEHEPSFKQQDPAPRYHARSVALMLARQFNAQVVLGTATPSMESFQNTVNGKYRLVQLTERYRGMQLPKIEIVDTADMYRRKMMQDMFSPRLLNAIRDAIADDRQVILFQNRRGFAPMVECHVCGWVPKCDNCDVSLTMHKTTNQLTCHYCGYTFAVPKQCPCCESHDVRVRGYGTERVEEALEQIFLDENNGYSLPEGKRLKIARMDLDTTRTKNAYERIISDFSEGKTNVLIGTQMVSKGLDFGRVSVVGIISADTMLNYPDFRAYEHAFQMMAQVSGRAGRKDKQGLVILQTRHPDLPVIAQVVRNDYRAFFTQQCQERELFRYPPFSRIIYVYLRHAKDPVVDSAAIEMGSRLRQLFGQRVLGPDRPAVARIKQLNIRKIVLKLELGIDLPRVRQYLRRVRDELLLDRRYASLQVYYDVDPM